MVEVEPMQYVVRGNNAILRCNVSGNPFPDVIWRREENALQETMKYRVLGPGLLEIRNVTEEDGGMYECFATSSLGSDSLNIMLNVLSKSLCV